jgi:hypothetical protein
MTTQRRRSGLEQACLVLALLVTGIVSSLLPRTASAYHVYYANLHSHSSLSDGIGTPQEAYAYARDVANIDVLALTEHTSMITQTDYNTLISAANEYTQTGVFVALAAQEFGNLNDFGHMNVYDSPYRIPNAQTDLTGTYAYIIAVGAFGCFNHPSPDYGTNFNNLQYYPEYAEAMRAIEIRNGLAVDSYEPQYVQALSNGWKVGPLAGQDNHEGHWGDQINPNSGYAIYLTGILADTLTRPAILDALRSRRFFAMEVSPPSDRMELDFRVDGQPMGSEVVTDINPHFTATARSVNGISFFNRFELYRDGVVCLTQISIGTTIYFDAYDGAADGESHYYFLRAHQVDGDFCWSAPVWVTVRATEASVEAGEAAGHSTSLRGWPNPFVSSTELRFTLPATATPSLPGSVDHRGGAAGAENTALADRYRVRLTLYDLSGRQVTDLGSRVLPPGPQAWVWDGRDQDGRSLPTGVYFGRLSADAFPARSVRLVLLR